MRIRNWDRWQTWRKDRIQPPWIKLHRTLLRNPEWIALTDAQRGQLVCMWMLAADKNGNLPDDLAVIRKLCFLDNEPDLTVFIDKGFVEMTTKNPNRGNQDGNNGPPNDPETTPDEPDAVDAQQDLTPSPDKRCTNLARKLPKMTPQRRGEERRGEEIKATALRAGSSVESVDNLPDRGERGADRGELTPEQPTGTPKPPESPATPRSSATPSDSTSTTHIGPQDGLEAPTAWLTDDQAGHLRSLMARIQRRWPAKWGHIQVHFGTCRRNRTPWDVLHAALVSVLEHEPEEPGAYLHKILRVEEPNHHEAQAVARGSEWKTAGGGLTDLIAAARAAGGATCPKSS